MAIKQIYADNAGRNFNYIIACDQTGDALVIDPYDSDACLQYAETNQFHITHIINTHEHWDHTHGNATLAAATGARILAHANAVSLIDNVDQGLHEGDIIQVGNSIQLQVLDTPGHTRAHLCLYGELSEPVLFCGDTLFNAGVGNCHHGGDPALLYDTFEEEILKLPDTTRVYPGHDYMLNNLRFTLSVEPSNQAAADLLLHVEHQDPNHAFTSTLGLEKQINTFFRLNEPNVIAELQHRFPGLSSAPSAKEVFLRLRQLRDKW